MDTIHTFQLMIVRSVPHSHSLAAFTPPAFAVTITLYIKKLLNTLHC